jgi:hypothetical protein
MGECTDGLDVYNGSMVDNFLELDGCFVALMRSQIGFSAHKNGVQSSPTGSTGCRLS